MAGLRVVKLRACGNAAILPDSDFGRTQRKRQSCRDFSRVNCRSCDRIEELRGGDEVLLLRV